jgi:hypothetical protein
MKRARFVERSRGRRVMEAYRVGMTTPETIGPAVGLPPGVVRKILRQAGVPLDAVGELTQSELGHPQRGRNRLGEVTHQTNGRKG